MIRRVEEFDNLVVLRTFSKAYAMAALRVGYAAANSRLAEMMMCVKIPYSLNMISEGAAKTNGSDLAALLSAENYYNCFADTPFADQDCTLRVLMYHWSFYLAQERYGIYVPEWMNNNPDAWSILTAMPVRIHRTCIFRLRTLDFSQYHYLKALNNLETFGTEVNFLVEPTTLPSNVEGGLGFVGIETITETPYAQMEREYGPEDMIYY